MSAYGGLVTYARGDPFIGYCTDVHTLSGINRATMCIMQPFKKWNRRPKMLVVRLIHRRQPGDESKPIISAIIDTYYKDT
jgi:hypothetical protein